MFRTLADAEDFLRTRADFERRSRQGWRPDLAPIRALVGALGDPLRAVRIVHVGGTKGKGSTATFVAELLRAGGARVGLYTSPHLERITERIVVDGEEIGAAAFADALGRAAAIVSQGGEAARASAFDLLTAAAFAHFAERGVEWAVVEVGLGGRLDSTNVVRPDVCVLTNVALEHTEVLGGTVAEIAREKAGIVKAGVPVVTGFEGEARAILGEIARERGAPLRERGRDFAVEAIDRNGDGGLRVTLCSWRSGTIEARLPGSGRFQGENLAFALAALDALAERGSLPGLDARAALAAAAPRLTVRGRFEILGKNPPVVLDGAHTPASVAAALESVADAFPGRAIAAVFGASRDKDLDGMLSLLRGRADTVGLATVGTARAASVEELAARAGRIGLRADEGGDPVPALERAIARAGPGGVVLALGSLHLVGALRARAVGREEGGATDRWTRSSRT